MVPSPIPYTPDVEDVQPDEPHTVDQLCKAFYTILETTAENAGHAVRAVHAKAHGILEGELRIDVNLPAELAQGLFANAGDILPDAIFLPCGLAIKVFDVEGERLPGADGAAQDFVMVNGTVFQAK